MAAICDRVARCFAVEHAAVAANPVGAIGDPALATAREAPGDGVGNPGRGAAANGPQKAAVGHVPAPHPKGLPSTANAGPRQTSRRAVTINFVDSPQFRRQPAPANSTSVGCVKEQFLRFA
jgi:hypothetical protein